jgi:hypothetical protein
MLLRVAIASVAAFIKSVCLMMLLVPAYLAAFRYAFRSPHLWPTEPEGSSPTLMERK